MGKTGKIALTAIFTAFSVVLLYLAAVLPTGRMGLCAAASLFGVAAVIEAGAAAGAAVYAGALLLGFLLLPEKSALLLYGCFFGYYPVMKLFAERLRNRLLEWCVKLAVLNAALTLLLFVFSATVFDFSFLGGRRWLLYPFCSVLFVLFDLGVSGVIAFYLRSIRGRIKK